MLIYLIPICAYSILYALLFLVPNLLPLFVGVFIDLVHMGPAEAAWIGAAYFGMMAVVAFGTTYSLRKAAPRALAFWAVTLQLAGFLLPFKFQSVWCILVAMGIMGAGNGALFAVVNASGAMEKNPILVYGAGIVLSNLLTSVVPSPLYASVARFGVPGLFVPALSIIPLVFVSLRILPSTIPPYIAPSKSADRQKGPALSLPAVMLLSAIFLINAFLMAYYAYADRLLVSRGVRQDNVALIFTLIYVAAAGAGAVAMILARWPHKHLWYTTGLTVILAAANVGAMSTSSPSFVVAFMVVSSVVSMLGMSVQFSVAAQIDDTGQVAAIASGASFLAWSLGPVVGGCIFPTHGFIGIIFLTIFLACVSVLLLSMVRLGPKVTNVKAGILN